MSEYFVGLFWKVTAQVLSGLLVTIPFCFGWLWVAREAGVFEAAGWSDPTNLQIFLVALFVATFGR